MNLNDRKRQFLSDYFLHDKINSEILYPNNFQDFEDTTKNKIYWSITPWNVLLTDSKQYDIKIVPGPLEKHPCGFILEDKTAQELFEAAFYKTMVGLIPEVDYDEETLLFNMIEYILIHNLHKKGLNELVKKLKNLNAEALPY